MKHYLSAHLSLFLEVTVCTWLKRELLYAASKKTPAATNCLPLDAIKCKE